MYPNAAMSPSVNCVSVSIELTSMVLPPEIVRFDPDKLRVCSSVFDPMKGARSMSVALTLLVIRRVFPSSSRSWISLVGFASASSTSSPSANPAGTLFKLENSPSKSSEESVSRLVGMPIKSA